MFHVPSSLSERTNQTKIALAGSPDPALEWAKQGALSRFCSIWGLDLAIQTERLFLSDKLLVYSEADGGVEFVTGDDVSFAPTWKTC